MLQVFWDVIVILQMAPDNPHLRKETWYCEVDRWASYNKHFHYVHLEMMCFSSIIVYSL